VIVEDAVPHRRITSGAGSLALNRREHEQASDPRESLPAPDYEDYRLIHSLCRLFLDVSSISETPGEIPFRGFRLDMYELFERFVTEAFQRAARGTSFSNLAQKNFSLSEQSSDFPVTIVPDVTVCGQGTVVSIVDAKYKRTDSGFANHDFYQVLAYGTALNCPYTYLFFPTSEYAKDGQIKVKQSSVMINIYNSWNRQLFKC